MSGLTFKSFAGNNVGLNPLPLSSTTLGSFLVAACLCAGGTSDPMPNITDSFGNEWSFQVSQAPPPPYNAANGNTLYIFYAVNKGSGNLTLTLNFSGSHTIRFMAAEYTGQAAGNPIAAFAGVLYDATANPQTLNYFLSGTGVIPLPKAWTNLTAILMQWSNPPTSGLSNFDGGSGTIRIGSSAQGIGIFDDVLSNTKGFYTPSITVSGGVGAMGSGNVILVKSASSTFIENFMPNDIIATDETNIRSTSGSRMSTEKIVSLIG